MVPESSGKEEEEIMPMPFHCIECDKPIQQALRGLCDNCKKTMEEENARKTQLEINKKEESREKEKGRK